jgi:prepilin signal peptidase PulO-like enzyme (type II secretory pathway)
MGKIILSIITVYYLVKIAYLDYRYKYIADKDVLLASATVLILQYIRGNLRDALGGTIIATSSAVLLYVFAYLKYKYAAFGSGDVTLLFFLGSLVGLERLASWAMFSSLFFLSIIGFQLLRSGLTRKTAVPLAPFLNFATLLWFVGENFLWTQVLRIMP